MYLVSKKVTLRQKKLSVDNNFSCFFKYKYIWNEEFSRFDGLTLGFEALALGGKVFGKKEGERKS